jgi:hypothetical protein
VKVSFGLTALWTPSDVTLTSLEERVAPLLIPKVAVMVVEFITVTPDTVIPLPETATVEPAAKYLRGE